MLCCVAGSMRRRERARENSLLSHKDSYFTNYNQETPPSSLSILTNPDTFYLASNSSISISTNKKASVCLRMSTSSLHRHTAATETGRPLRQRSLEKGVLDKSVSASRCLPPADTNDFVVHYDPKNRMTNTGYGIKPSHYTCKRSVSFTLSVEESRQVAKEDQVTPTKTHRSRSLYGIPDHRRLKLSQRGKMFRNPVYMNTRV